MKMVRAALTLLLLATGSGALLANPSLEGYADHVAFVAQVRELEKCDVVAARSLGKSVGGRDVWLLTIGTANEVDRKPAIVVLGNLHGPHLAGAELAMRMAQRLAKFAESDPKTGELLKSHTFYFIPRPSPDACEKCFAAPYREAAGNERKTDDDRDFEFGEDPPDDLNGDGWITQMRVADPTGGWRTHPDDPRILIPIDPKKNERGEFRVLTEGKDDDGDEAWSEDGGDGVELNRNFPFRYEPFAKGTGPHAVSEPEHRALADFLFDRPNVALVFSFSPENNLFHPWKPNPQAEGARHKTTVRSADAPILEYLASEYRELHGGKDVPAAVESRGSVSQWAYFYYGRWSLSARGWWVPKIDPPAAEGEAKKPTDSRAADQLNALRWLEREKIDGFVPWTKVEHPDFPGREVEVGGFKPFYLLNAPAKELDALAEKHLSFVTKLPEWFPELAITESRAEHLGGGIVRIRATVANVGFLPTMSEIGQINGEAYPLWGALDLPEGTTFLQGSRRTKLPRLTGSGGKTERTWLVRIPGELPGTISLSFAAPSVGSVEQAIEIRAAESQEN
jgi:hypothetical protein